MGPAYQHESSAMVYMAITKDAEASMEEIFEQTDTLNNLLSPSVQDQHPCQTYCLAKLFIPEMPGCVSCKSITLM